MAKFKIQKGLSDAEMMKQWGGNDNFEESPLCIECRVKEIVSLGSHDMFISDVVNIRADDRHLNRETGKLELAEANPLVYVHGGYYNLGEKIGKFGWSVEKKTK